MLLIKLATLAVLSSLASCQTPATCSDSYDSYISLQGSSDNAYLGTIPGVHRHGLDGHLDPLLVTRHANGTALGPTLWSFFACSSLKDHAVPPGYSPPGSGPVRNSFGIIRPMNDQYGCLALATAVDNTTGVRNALVLARNCTQVPERYRTFMFENYIYGEVSDTERVFYANADDTGYVANTTHGEAELVTNYKGSHGRQFLFGPADFTWPCYPNCD